MASRRGVLRGAAGLAAGVAMPVITARSKQILRSPFVTRQGSDLYLNGSKFRFSGPNIFWLGLLEDNSASGTGVHYPSQSEIDAVLTDAATMAAKVVRTHGFCSVGGTLSIETGLGVFNSGGFQAIDYAVYQAKQRGIKIIAPLVDNYNYYHGGKYTFLNWRGITNDGTDAGSTAFYTDSTVRQDFKDYITYVLTHVNPYTGLQYKDEPAIMAWETGNEMSSYPTTWTFSAWTADIAAHIKTTLGAQQLVVDGHYGIYTTGTTVDSTSLGLSNVDLYTQHSYDDFRTPTEISSEGDTVAASNKVFFMGEYTWTDKDSGGTTLSWTLGQMITAVEGNSHVAGDLFWSLFPGGINHGDGFTLHYPGDDSNMITRATQLKNHAAAM